MGKYEILVDCKVIAGWIRAIDRARFPIHVLPCKMTSFIKMDVPCNNK
jgi:hypothetical protein